MRQECSLAHSALRLDVRAIECGLAMRGRLVEVDIADEFLVRHLFGFLHSFLEFLFQQ
jgi:hypothetical protein